MIKRIKMGRSRKHIPLSFENSIESHQFPGDFGVQGGCCELDWTGSE
jgi:hypothetical protein